MNDERWKETYDTWKTAAPEAMSAEDERKLESHHFDSNDECTRCGDKAYMGTACSGVRGRGP